MTFLNSVFLAALAAVVIPLLIHFLSRRRIKIVDFSSLKFLFQMQKSKLRWLRILEILLLILRMLVLALIALAFARPAFTGKNPSSHSAASIVVLIDNSPSVETISSAGTVLDELKNSVSDLIDVLKPGDEITLITLSGEPKTIGPSSDFERTRSDLYLIRPGYAAPDLNNGLKKAAMLLGRSHNLNREIYLATDMQDGSWWDIDSDNIDPSIRYFSVAYPIEPDENVGINRIDFPAQLLTPGEQFTITPVIRNYSDKAVSSKLVELFIDGKKKAQTAVDLKPRASKEVVFNVTSDLSGRHRGYFQIEDDDYGQDNRFYFNYDIPQRINVLGLGGGKPDVNLLRGCFGNDNSGYLNFDGAEISALSRSNLSAYDVVILSNVASLSQLQFNNLADFLAGGGGLFIILGSRSNPEAYADFLKENAGIEIKTKVSISGVRTDQAYYPLKSFNLSHPIFSVYEPGNQYQAEIPQMRLFEYVPLAGGISLANIEDESSVMTHSEASKVIVAGFGIDRQSSDISLHSFIVPMVIRSAEYLALRSSTLDEYFIAGEPVNISLPGKLDLSTVGLSFDNLMTEYSDSENPSYTDKTLEVSRGAYGAFVNISHAEYPGFYTLKAASDTLGIFSVNHDSLQSTGSRITSEHLRNLFGGRIVLLDSEQDLKDQVMQAKFGYEIWAYLLAVALLLLLVESLLVRKALSN